MRALEWIVVLGFLTEFPCWAHEMVVDASLCISWRLWYGIMGIVKLKMKRV